MLDVDVALSRSRTVQYDIGIINSNSSTYYNTVFSSLCAVYLYI